MATSLLESVRSNWLSAERASRAVHSTGPDPSWALLEPGDINERQYKGLLHLRARGVLRRHEYVELASVSERPAARELAERNLLELGGGAGGALFPLMVAEQASDVGRALEEVEHGGRV